MLFFLVASNLAAHNTLTRSLPLRFCSSPPCARVAFPLSPPTTRPCSYPVTKLLDQLMRLNDLVASVKNFCGAGQEFHSDSIKLTDSLDLQTECKPCAIGEAT